MNNRTQLRQRRYLESKYPTCWSRASSAIRRLAGGICQRCRQSTSYLEVHHIGAPYATGTPGDPRDKHDIRQENLLAICLSCHEELEHVIAIRKRRRVRLKKHRMKLRTHRALGIGTGLVLWEGPWYDTLALRYSSPGVPKG